MVAPAEAAPTNEAVMYELNEGYVSKETPDIFYSEVEKGGKCTAALSILADEAKHFEEIQQAIMTEASEFEFRNGDKDRAFFLEMEAEDLRLKKLAMKYYTGEERTQETAKAAVDVTDWLMRRSISDLNMAMLGKNADTINQLTNLCMALDTGRGYAHNEAFPKAE